MWFNETNSTEAQYNDKLIETLEEDHRFILALLYDIQEDCNNKNYKSSLDKLEELITELKMHIFIENMNLYKYIVENSDEKDIEFSNKLKNSSVELIDIIDSFASKWIEPDFDNSKCNIYIKELKEIEILIRKRMSFEEEKLFKLYIVKK